MGTLCKVRLHPHNVLHCSLCPFTNLNPQLNTFWSLVNTTSATQLTESSQTQGYNPKAYKKQNNNIGKMALHMSTLHVIIILPVLPWHLGFTHNSVLFLMYRCNSDLRYFSILPRQLTFILQQPKNPAIQKMPRREDISCPFGLGDTYGLWCYRMVLFHIWLFLEGCQHSPYACNFLSNQTVRGFPRVKGCLGPS